MKNLVKVVLFLAVLCLALRVALAADPGPDSATCDVTVTVNTVLEWSDTSYTDIALDPITSTTDTPFDSRAFTLYTNCNCEISADNTTAAQLENEGASTDTLVTKYQLEYDGDGSSATGGTDISTWTDYSTFLSPASAVTHVDGDGIVVVTLWAEASSGGQVRDPGSYRATQTLTAAWTSD